MLCMKRKDNFNHRHINKFINIKDVIDKRYNILSIIIIALIAVVFLNLFYLQVIKKDHYDDRLNFLTGNIVSLSTAPRGLIYDRNGVLIVGNEADKVISYSKSGLSALEEIRLAYLLGSYIDVDFSKLNDYSIRDFWLKQNLSEANSRITASEWEALSHRKLTMTDIDRLRRSRITDLDLAEYTLVDKEAAYIYYLMNVGYSYSDKVIKRGNVSDYEYALVAENLHLLTGFNVSVDWNRFYPYGSVGRSILGSVSTSTQGIPLEHKDYFLSLGYRLNDRVGLSGIEFQYESLLMGKKNEYLRRGSNISLYSSGSRGTDLYLTIDIELQAYVESVLEKDLLAAKGERNTKELERAYAIVSDPMTGEILAMAGKEVRLVDGKYVVFDATPGVYSNSVVPGSIVKGASQIVGYNTGVLKIGDVRNDACIKIAATPLKCSFRYYGDVDDKKAMAVSSNTYQFHTAMLVGGAKYVYNGPLKVDTKAFDIYRDTFKEFGLGVHTGIDLPNERLGYFGTSRVAGLLLDFSIGQYDTYTPIQLSQYINTIAASGNRYAPYLVMSGFKDGNLVYSKEPSILNKVNTEEQYMDRLRDSFRAVFEVGGTGYNAVYPIYEPAGKTGTSQSFKDTNGDGKIDTETISRTLGAYAPFDNPRMSLVVVVPDVSIPGGNYISNVDRRIARQISEKFFAIYP